MRHFLTIIILTFFAALPLSAAQRQFELVSPDGLNVMTVTADKDGIVYSVSRDGSLLFKSARLSMAVGDDLWGAGDRLKKVRRNSVDVAVSFTVPRKYRSTKEQYNALTLVFNDYDIEFRAYNDGVAHRFVGKKDAVLQVREENAGWRFAEDCLSYTLLTDKLQNWFEENYTVSVLSELPRDKFSIAPVMVRADNAVVLLAEANLYNYSGSYLRPTGNGFDYIFADYPSELEFFDGTNKLYATERYDYIVKCNVARTFPWRVAGIFQDDISMLGSELIYLLSDRTADDFSWVKPGKVLWDWWNDRNIYGVDFVSGINTATYMYLVDYAAVHGFEYILIDEGWSEKDDLLTLNPETDIPGICAYAAAHGVGVCLWAKWINVDRQMDEAFALMSSWGVAGVKIDFMDRNDAIMVNFYERVAKKAAECKMLVDFHGSYPNEGMRAKYPNLMTREGVLGLEYNKWSNRATPEHQLIIPYLRQWAGPMDFTPGAMLNVHQDCFLATQREPMGQGTRCHHLAMYVIYESPLQMLSDSPSKYDENPDCLPFLEAVPSVWDDTIPLWGAVGKDIALARRSGDDYYIAVMSSGEKCKKMLNLSFLPDGKYEMSYYADGINAGRNAKDYKHGTCIVDNKDIISVELELDGGYVAVLRKL